MKQQLATALPNQSDLQRLASAAVEPDLTRRWERLQQTLEPIVSWPLWLWKS
jgi:hypothetical protein